MTYEELIQWGMAHYCEGGDVFVECWSESDYDEYVKMFGPMTKQVAADMAQMYANLTYGEI